MENQERTLEIEPQLATEFFGKLEENLKLIATGMGIKLHARGNQLLLAGPAHQVERATELVMMLQSQIRKGQQFSRGELNYLISLAQTDQLQQAASLAETPVVVTARGKKILPRTIGQQQYVEAIRNNDLCLGIGPAGTGKTYLAVALAVVGLQSKAFNRLILTRPAVEAGEKLGFLPGDLQEKVDPYLRPLYDAIYDLMGVDLFQKYLERGIIEIAPLAYMRGRTLDDSFIILDEAQNTTPEQMKMFLTRLGFSSKAVVTGDITQIDLPKGSNSGLIEVAEILKGIPGIATVYLSDRDVVRHELVQRIIQAYERHHQSQQQSGVTNEPS